jgi:drug/metabolite transporter (DMT)-like permease
VNSVNSAPNSASAHIALAAVAIFYGVNYFTLKAVFGAGIDSFAVLGIRSLITTLFFVVYHRLAIRERITDRKDFRRLLLAALLGVALNQTFFIWGVSLTSRVNASVLMILTPVFVFFAAWALKQERITLSKLAGLAISFVGAAGLILMRTQQQNADSGASISGDILIMLNAAFYGLYLVVVRPLFQKYNTFTIIKWLFLIGSIPHILLGAYPLSQTAPALFTPNAIFGIAFLIIFATIGAYWLNAWAMKRLPSSAVGIYIYVQPVFVTLISAVVGLGEVNGLTIPFILLIFAGVWLVTKRRAIA